MAEEKEFFIYEDHEDVDVSYAKKAPEKPKETVIGIPGASEHKKEVAKPEREIKKGAEVKKTLDKKTEPQKEKKKELKTPSKETKKEETGKKVEKKVTEFGEKKEEPKEESTEIEEEPEDKSSNLPLIFAIIAIIVVIVVIFAIKGRVGSSSSDKDTAAIVNGEVISLSELNESYSSLPEQYKLFVTKESVLDTLIEQKILQQEAEKQGFTATEKEVDDAIEEVLKQNLLTKGEFEELAKEKGLSMDEIRGMYKKQIMVDKLLEEEIRSKAKINEKEIKDYYDNMIRASHILVQTEGEAKEILAELKNGGDFAELAKEKSIDKASAMRGGDLGEFSKGQMVPEFEEAAFKLKEGEISGIVKTAYGYHIIKRTPKTLTYEETRDKIRDILTAPEQQKLYSDYINKLRENAKITIYLEKEIPESGESKEEAKGVEEVKELEKTEEVKAAGKVISGKCFENFGLSSDTVVFYYADWCLSQEQCKGTKAIIDELEKEGYKFSMAQVGDTVMGCFNLENKNLVPQFICAGTGKIKVGSLSKENLKRFADECK